MTLWGPFLRRDLSEKMSFWDHHKNVKKSTDLKRTKQQKAKNVKKSMSCLQRNRDKIEVLQAGGGGAGRPQVCNFVPMQILNTARCACNK